MRKDYIVSANSPSDETAFVEEYWTGVWDRVAGGAGHSRKIEATEEYQVMAPYLARLPADAKLLDGGCGLGDFVLYFHQRGFQSSGMDLSRKTIAILREKFPGVDFRDGDIRHMDCPADSIDAYYSWGVFEHFEAGMGDCLAEAYRVLKPGGHLFITVPYDNFRQAVRAALEAPKPAAAQARFYQWRFTKAELMRELSLKGFRVERLQPMSKREGVYRSLHHDFGLPFEWRLTRAASRLLAPIVPGGLIGHMIMAVARKPGGADGQ